MHTILALVYRKKRRISHGISDRIIFIQNNHVPYIADKVIDRVHLQSVRF
jgi:hypothetical protein